MIFLIRIWNKNRKKNAKISTGTKSSLFMNQVDYLTPQKSIFQIPGQSVKPFNLEVGEHRDRESKKNYIENLLIIFSIIYKSFIKNKKQTRSLKISKF